MADFHTTDHAATDKALVANMADFASDLLADEGDLPEAVAGPAGATVTFAQMVPMFQALYEPEPIRLTALIGRVKNYLRLGACAAAGSKKGVATKFRLQEVRELLILMELGHIGVPPHKAMAMFRDHEKRPYTGVLDVVISSTGSGRISLHEQPLLAAVHQHLPELLKR